MFLIPLLNNCDAPLQWQLYTIVFVLGSTTASLKTYSAALSVEHVAPTIFIPWKDKIHYYTDAFDMSNRALRLVHQSVQSPGLGGGGRRALDVRLGIGMPLRVETRTLFRTKDKIQTPLYYTVLKYGKTSTRLRSTNLRMLNTVWTISNVPYLARSTNHVQGRKAKNHTLSSGTFPNKKVRTPGFIVDEAPSGELSSIIIISLGIAAYLGTKVGYRRAKIHFSSLRSPIRSAKS